MCSEVSPSDIRTQRKKTLYVTGEPVSRNVFCYAVNSAAAGKRAALRQIKFFCRIFFMVRICHQIFDMRSAVGGGNDFPGVQG